MATLALILPDLSYDCVGCGKSCTAFQVEITPTDLSRLTELPVTHQLQANGYQPLRLLASGRVVLGKEAAGRCTYLTPSTRCSIHPSKPLPCQGFPFRAVETPDGIFVGVSFLCTAVANGYGRPIEAHRVELSKRFDKSESSPHDRWLLWDELAVDWPTYLQIESLLSSSLAADPDQGLLAAATRVARSVSPAPGSTSSPWLTHLLFGLLTLIETAGEPPEAISVVHRALHQGAIFDSRALGAPVDPSRLSEALPDWFPAQASRLLQHLLFRKILLEPPDVLSRVCLMPLISDALRFYTRASAQKHRRSFVPEDFFEAAAILEGRLLLHAGGMDSYFKHVGRVFLANI